MKKQGDVFCNCCGAELKKTICDYCGMESSYIFLTFNEIEKIIDEDYTISRYDSISLSLKSIIYYYKTKEVILKLNV